MRVPARGWPGSLPDLYLPRAQLDDIARAHATNALLQGRGQPGTHDLALGTRLLTTLRALHRGEPASVELPVFEKSCYEGLGDRLSEARIVQAPIDIVLFEGWCLGFATPSEHELAERLEALRGTQSAAEQQPLESLRTISRFLRAWEEQCYPLLDVFVQLLPRVEGKRPWDVVYPWRLQAEHEMKEKNGGHGMTDEQVWEFVQRYLPSYELFCNDLSDGQRWLGNGLRLAIDADRRVVDSREF